MVELVGVENLTVHRQFCFGKDTFTYEYLYHNENVKDTLMSINLHFKKSQNRQILVSVSCLIHLNKFLT